MNHARPFALIALVVAARLAAQDAPASVIETESGQKVEVSILGSPNLEAGKPASLFVLYDPGFGMDADTRRGLGEAFAVVGLELIAPRVADEAALLAVVDALRCTRSLHRLELCLVTTAGTFERSPNLRGPRRFEFARIVLVGPIVANPPDLGPSVLRHAIASPEDRGALSVELASRREAPRPHEALAGALDRLHEAAARADEDTYLASFTDDAVFLGTDAQERWDLPAFKAFLLPHFQKRTAWTFVPTARNITVEQDGKVAWFDERVHSASYGECRGTGVLRLVGGQWKVALYDLTVPVPNDLLGDVVKGIRLRNLLSSPRTQTVSIWIVRHAEKDTDSSESNPPLSVLGRARAQALVESLRSLSITEIFATEFLRTQETVQPLAEVAGKTVTRVDAAAGPSLAADLRQKSEGTFVIASHSNVIPRLIAELGGPSDIELAETDYDNLFLITLDAQDRTSFHRLHYGQKAP